MKSRWTSPAAGAAVILLLTVLACFPALRGGFIWDDKTLIIDNRMVKARDGLYRLWFTTEPVDYWPLTSTLWWLEWRLWGKEAFGYHAANVLLHAAAAVLIWMILRRLAVPGAWLAALVFAIHPVNVATAAWISEHKNTLSMLLYAVAILLYLKFDRENRWRWYGLSLTAFLLALLSKAAVVVLPIVLLLCLWWLHGGLRRRDWLASVPFFALSLVLGLVTVWFQYHRAMEGHAARTEGFLSRLAAAGWVPWFYLYKLLVPFRLTVIYPRWDVNGSQWTSFLPGAALTGCLVWLWWRRATWWGRPLFFGVAYFVVTLFPVMGFFQQGFFSYSLVADHWQYYSNIGVIALAVAAGVALCRRTEHRRHWGIITAASVLAVLGVMTFHRSGVYAGDETLWRDNLTKNPDCWMAYVSLGQDMAAAGSFEAAIGYYEQALRIDPGDAETHVNLGVALMNLGKRDKAVGQYNEALRIKPRHAEAHNNLGVAFAQEGRLEQAIGQFTQSLQIDPKYTEAQNNIGITLVQLGRTQEAVPYFEQAVRIDPDYAEAHYGLGMALERLGRTQAAILEYEQALSLQPSLTAAKDALARLHAEQ